MDIQQAFKEVTGLSVEEGIEKAIEGGLEVYTGELHHCNEKTLLNPLYWKSIGKAIGKGGVPITFRETTFLVDSEFVPEASNWSWELQKGYVRGTKKGTKGKVRCFLHRIVIGQQMKDGEMVDHINGNRLDNRRSNLRIVNAKESARNKNAIKSGKYRGTYFHKPKKTWAAVVVFDRKKFYAGYFKDREVAAEEAEKLRQKLYGVLYNKSSEREWWIETWHRFIDALNG